MDQHLADPRFWTIMKYGLATVGGTIVGSIYWLGKQEIMFRVLRTDVNELKKATKLLMPLSRCEERQTLCKEHQMREFDHDGEKFALFSERMTSLEDDVAEIKDKADKNHAELMRLLIISNAQTERILARSEKK